VLVGNSSDDGGISAVRFAYDDQPDGAPRGRWSEWYGWSSSRGAWNATSKALSLELPGRGVWEVWVEVRDSIGQTSKCRATVRIEGGEVWREDGRALAAAAAAAALAVVAKKAREARKGQGRREGSHLQSHGDDLRAH